jgi:hypothetical protein
MNKLRAIWKILWAHQYAVFSFKEAAPDPTWLTVPTFSWVISKNWKENHFFWFICERLKKIEEFDKLSNQKDSEALIKRDD